MFRLAAARSLFLIAALALVTVGATSVRAQDGDEGMFGKRKPKPVENTPAKPTTPLVAKPVEKRTGSWAIVLGTFRGEKQDEQAREMLAKVSAQKELAGAFVDSRGGGKATVVAVGRFADPSSPEALAKLERVRAIEVAERKPFSGAFLAPPGELTNLGQRPEFNLALAKEQYGKGAEYTLQIAVYGRKDILDEQKRNPTEEELKESRKTAEEAAAKLRQEGELAFFFHGPRYSSVTIGVWSDSDFAKRRNASTGEPARLENPDLTSARLRFPHNLYNGAGVRVKTKDNKEEVQASVIVKIPER
jgi:hypothetical protein